MYKITNLKMRYTHNEESLLFKIKKQLGIEEIKHYEIIKQSLDARKKPDLYFLYTVIIDTDEAPHPKAKDCVPYEPKPAYSVPKYTLKGERPVIVGFGPAGMFCGLVLAQAGLKPIILERGSAVDKRMEQTEHFFMTGELNLESNIQFGEGGAGTFSDGKLSTGVKDKFGRKEYILDTFIEHGAPKEIKYSNKPHIGTDYLTKVVKSMRETIISLGGEVHFDTKMTDFEPIEGGINVITTEETFKTDDLVLAIGHSARDTFEMLTKTSLKMEQKAFAMGLRVQHDQSVINDSQYGKGADMAYLPVADYKLTYRTKKERGVYSFCMCPGGFVVNSSSEEGHIACNGMSDYKRDAMNANSAILVNVIPEDFGSDDILAGVEMQRKYEALAYIEGGSNNRMPIQTYGDYLMHKKTKDYGRVKPGVKGDVAFGDLNKCLPRFINDAIKEAMPKFGNRIKGFDNRDVLFMGVESRSSSPIKMLRDKEEFVSNIPGLYPCGEGAGYAGGIMSAAIDGIKVAEAIIG